MDSHVLQAIAHDLGYRGQQTSNLFHGDARGLFIFSKTPTRVREHRPKEVDATENQNGSNTPEATVKEMCEAVQRMLRTAHRWKLGQRAIERCRPLSSAALQPPEVTGKAIQIVLLMHIFI
jgi:hypothetical protein